MVNFINSKVFYIFKIYKYYKIIRYINQIQQFDINPRIVTWNDFYIFIYIFSAARK